MLNKRYIISSCYLLSSLISVAQHTIVLNPFVKLNGIQPVSSVRDVQELEDGLLVTYTMESINVCNDIIFSASHIFQLEGFGQNHEIGKPSIPITSDTFVIPLGKCPSISVVDSSYIYYDVELAPSKPLCTEWENFSVSHILPYKGLYPLSNIVSSAIREYRGYELLDICMTPIQYNYEKKRVRIYDKVSYKITWNNKSNSINKTKLLPNDSPLKSLVSSSIRERTAGDAQQTTEDYLIITTNTFLNAAQKFREWKRTMGFNAQIVSQQSWTASSVKEAIRDVYEDPNKNLQYVLIIGDEDDVPPYQYIYYNDRLSFPVDLDYSCMGGLNDTESDIYMGRISVHSNSEALIVVDKIIDYEKTPIEDNSFYNSAMVSTYLQAESNDTEEKTRSYAKTTEDVRNSLAAQGKTVYRVYNANDSVTPRYWYNNGQKVMMPVELQDTSIWRGDASNVIDIINSGVSFVLHRDHGWEYCWPFVNFTTTDITLLNNERKLPVVFSVDCQCGQFNHFEDCFSEAFLKQEHGGCVAIIAASGVTYSYYNNKMAKNLIEAIWPSNTGGGINPVYRMGSILKRGLLGIYDNSSRKYYMCFGDPSMMIYSTPPVAFNTAIIKRDADSITVSTDDDNSQIAFYNRSTGEVESYVGTIARSSLVGEDVTVCISAPNKITFMEDLRDSLYLQNETVSGTKIYRGSKINVGSDVTNSKLFGPVVFSGQKVTLVGREVELRGETTIQSGTIFEINNQ